MKIATLSDRLACVFVSVMVAALLVPCASTADITVTVAGPGGQASQALPNTGGTFDMNLPLNQNAVNQITVTAEDEYGNKAAQELAITQVSLDKIVVSKVTSERLSVEEVEQLVSDGVIDLDDPDNYNVSTFDIVLTIAKEPVPISIPIAMPKGEEPQGYETYKMPEGSDGSSNRPPPPPVQVVVFEKLVPGPPGEAYVSIPGVIIIEGRIKSLKEFYAVRLLLMNTSGIFTLSDVVANIEFPDGGLTSILPADGVISFGDILPGDGDQPGQKEKEFIIRGDEIGIRDVIVNFGGLLTGPGILIDEPIPFNGSATTDVEVKGPPTFEVQVTHPDFVTANEPYELEVKITNTDDIPAMYASLELDMGADGVLVTCELDENGEPVCTEIDGAEVRSLGHILAGETVTEIFTVKPLKTGQVSSCMGAADQNITLQVFVGTIGCMVGNFPPDRIPSDGTPAVTVLPLPNATGIHTDSPVVAFFSEEMEAGTITTGEDGSFNVFDSARERLPGQLRFQLINEKTAAIWQVNDGITNRLVPNAEYTVMVTTDVADLDGFTLGTEWLSTFTTTGTGIDDVTAPTLTLSVRPPVDPNFVLPGQIIEVNAYASDQGSGISRVEARIKDLDEPGATFQLVDQKTVFEGDLPPYIFAVNSGNLVAGHAYQFRGTAYDGNGNVRDSTISLLIAASADPPTILLPDDPSSPLLHGISLDVTPVEYTGGVREVRFYLDDATAPFKTVNLAPFQASLRTLGLPLGDHTVRAVAEDGLGQTGEDTLSLELAENINMPTVGFAGATDGTEYVEGTSILVSGTAEDPVGIQSMRYYLDGAPDPIFTGLAPILLDSAGLALGTHTVTLLATNNLGISNDIADPASSLTFSIVEPPPGPPPPQPTLTNVSHPDGSGVVVLEGTSVPGARIDVTNTSTGVTISTSASPAGAFSAQISAQIGDVLSVVAYDFTQSEDPSVAAEVTATAPPVLQSIDLSPPSMTFTAVNESQDIVVTGHYDNGSTEIITSAASFSSDDPAVASVGSSGTVVALSYGTATVTVTLGTFQELVAVTSNIIDLTHITVNPPTLDLVAIGQTGQLSVTGHYSNGSTQPLATGISYATGNPQIATVNSAGRVTAVGDGSTEITVSHAGVPPVAVPLTVDTGLDPAPTVTILSPADGSNVERGNLVSVTVQAQDAIGGVVRVTLDVSGETVDSQIIQVSPASLDTTQVFSFTVSNTAAVLGAIGISVQAEDTSGHTSDPTSITLNVVDETPPTVTITQPAQQAPFNFGDTVDIQVEASDAVGLSQIRFETTGTLSESGIHMVAPIAQTDSAHFSFSVPYGVGSPDATILAYALDLYGNEGAAIPVDIILTDADVTPPNTLATALSDPADGATLVVTYEVIDGLEDLDSVQLFFRRDGIGTFNRYTDADGGNALGHFLPEAGTVGTILFDSTRMGGDGAYEFYTVGVDMAGNREPEPDDGAGNVLPDQAAAIDAGTVWTVIDTATEIGDGDITYDGENLRIDGVTVTIDGAHSFRNVELINGAVLTHPETDMDFEYGISLTAWTLTLDATSSMNVDSRGYLGGYRGGNDCSGQTEGNTDGSDYRSGGSYGGLGGSYDGGIPNPVYGDLTAPLGPGSGGACYNESRPGGDGGGSVEIHATNIVSDGTISAGGGVGSGYQSGSGSGGSIYLVVSTLSGAGTVAANGGALEVGGGGGRIAVHYIDISTVDSSLIRALGGQGSYSLGGNGTVFLKSVEESNGTLVVDGQGASSAYSTLPIPPGYVFDNIVIRNNARVVADDVLVAHDAIRILTGSILTHSLESEAGLTIEAATVEVDETSSIDVTARGYRGGYRDGNNICEGLTLGGLPGASSRSGGSYGGRGGVHDGPGSNAPYGHPAEPLYLGSGGSCYGSGRPGGNGGGLIRIAATDAVVVDGSILANGASASGYQSGSGSGGSIKIDTSLLRGTGTIAADGYAYEVGGGGGRVAVTYDYLGGTGDDLDGLRNVTAFGGHGSHKWGSAGTVLMRRNDQAYGDLYIDDNLSGSTSSAYSPLTHIGFGQSTDLTGDTLTTDGLVKMVPNGLAGLRINPNLEQGETFVVLSNTEDTITVDASGGTLLTDVALPGDTYAGVYRFDNVFFRRGGFMVLGDRLVVDDTMLIDEYGRLTHYDATMTFESHLDLTVGTLEITDTGSINVDSRGYLGGYRGGNDCSGQTEGNTDGSDFRSGGSYGGLGGSPYSGIPNPVYGNLTAPSELGSGGACYSDSRPGGDGGGRVDILGQSIIVDGVISANGGAASGYQSGSGSGGTVRIDTSSLSGTGTIRANGYAHEVGGGGGRIAVYYDSLSLDESNFQVLGGQGSHSKGGNGTLFLRQSGQTYGDLVVDGLSQSTPDASSPIPGGYVFDNIVFRNNARVVADDPLVVNDMLQVLTGSTLTHSLESEAGLTIEAARVEVDAISSIDVSARGYRGGYRDGNSICEGLTLGGLPGASSRSGGSYGGRGGVHDGPGSNAPYGHPAEPLYLGSGGSCYGSGRPGGNGGGLIRIAATDAVVVDGSILANGAAGHSYQAGSGSGGSIKIDTSLLRGTGTIAANGYAHEVGGGGGRVAVTYESLGDTGDDLNGLRDINAFGGHGSYVWGSAGTVLMRRNDQAHGDLYIDDNVSGSTSWAYTPLTHIGFGRSADLTGDTLTTDGLVKMVPNGLVGLEINPNLDQEETFVVLSNTEDTITVDVSGGILFTDVALVGDTYAGIYRFDNVFFRRGGFMVAGDRLMVDGTMLIDEFGRLTHYDATMNFESHLDLTVETLEITDTGSINVDARGYLGGYRGGNDCSGQTEGNTDGSTRRSGGSYGGLGGSYDGGIPNPVYGDSTDPAELGSGGACYNDNRPGGDGGGRIDILGQDILVDGRISADGAAGSGYQSGSGSGGSIRIETSSLSGAGTIRANGYAHEVGGGGGRVAVSYESLSLPAGQITANGGAGSFVGGEPGTVHLDQQ